MEHEINYFKISHLSQQEAFEIYMELNNFVLPSLCLL